MRRGLREDRIRSKTKPKTRTKPGARQFAEAANSVPLFSGSRRLGRPKPVSGGHARTRGFAAPRRRKLYCAVHAAQPAQFNPILIRKESDKTRSSAAAKGGFVRVCAKPQTVPHPPRPPLRSRVQSGLRRMPRAYPVPAVSRPRNDAPPECMLRRAGGPFSRPSRRRVENPGKDSVSDLRLSRLGPPL